jgi:hypothetical protein
MLSRQRKKLQARRMSWAVDDNRELTSEGGHKWEQVPHMWDCRSQEERILSPVIKKKVKLFLCSIKHDAIKTYGGVEVRLHHSWPHHWMEVSGQLQATLASPLGRNSRYPLDRRQGRLQSRSGRCGVQQKSLGSAGNRTRPPAPTPSLYRLSYPGPW